MGVASIVVHLTERLAIHVRPELQSVLQVIATMPDHLANHDLTEWEDRCFDALEKVWPEEIGFPQLEKADPSLFLVNSIYEFGGYNLYGAYQAEPTKRQYQEVLELFRKHNIPGEKAVTEVDLSGW